MPDDTKELLDKLINTVEKAYQDKELNELSDEHQAILYLINRFAYLDEVFVSFLQWCIMFYFFCKRKKDAESLLSIAEIFKTYVGSIASGKGSSCKIMNLEDLLNKKGE